MYCKKGERPRPERNEDNRCYLTLRYLKALCDYNGQYNTPELVDNMYLNGVGIFKIENLEEYYNVKTLYLNDNGISNIENIEFMTELRHLYLQNNCIETIPPSISSHLYLTTLNLSHNSISSLAALPLLPNLTTLNLSHNPLPSLSFLESSMAEGGSALPVLRTLSISHSLLSAPLEAHLAALLSLPSLLSLSLSPSPLSRGTVHYRRSVLLALEQLVCLDERPVLISERNAVEAWREGGQEAEDRQRHAQNSENRAWEQRYLHSVRHGWHTVQPDEALYQDLQRLREHKLRVERMEQEREHQLKMLEELRDREEFITKEEERIRKIRLEVEHEKQKKIQEYQLMKQRIKENIEKQEEEKKKEEIQRKVELIRKRNETTRNNSFIRSYDVSGWTVEEDYELEKSLIEDRIVSIDESIEGSHAQIKIIEEGMEKRSKGEWAPLPQYYVTQKQSGEIEYYNLPPEKEEEIRYRDQEIQKEVAERMKKHNERIITEFVDDNQSEATLTTQPNSQCPAVLTKIQWNKELEDKLEAILESNMFDFEAAAASMNAILGEMGKEKGIAYKPLKISKLRKRMKEIEMNKYRWEEPTEATEDPFENEIPNFSFEESNSAGFDILSLD